MCIKKNKGKQEKPVSKQEKPLSKRVMWRLILGFILLFIFCVIVFEVLPNCGFLIFNSDGTWDWLSFVGSLAGMLLACWGVVKTIESSQETIHQQAILSAKPLLYSSLFSGYDKTILDNNDGLFYNCSISNRNITIDPEYYYLSYLQQTQYSDVFSVLRIKNIGLGAAVNISPTLYKVNLTEDKLNNIEKKGLPDIYAEVSINNEPSYKLTSFSLNNDSSTFYIVFNQKTYTGNPAHYILTFSYADMYEKKYTQKQYLLLNDLGCRPLHISEQEEDN